MLLYDIYQFEQLPVVVPIRDKHVEFEPTVHNPQPWDKRFHPLGRMPLIYAAPELLVEFDEVDQTFSVERSNDQSSGSVYSDTLARGDQAKYHDALAKAQLTLEGGRRVTPNFYEVLLAEYFDDEGLELRTIHAGINVSTHYSVRAFGYTV